MTWLSMEQTTSIPPRFTATAIRQIVSCSDISATNNAYQPDVIRFQISFRRKMTIALILTWVGTACWGVCFWWMHRLSSRQEMMLKELHDVTKRIEKLSKVEHDLIQEVHPKVEEIKESVKDVSDKVSEQTEGRASARPASSR